MKRPFLPNISLYIVLIIIVVISMIVLKRCDYSHFDAAPSGGDTIDVCIEYSPLSCYMYDDTIGGFEYDLMRMVAKRGNLKIKFHNAVTLQKGLNGLDNGNFDILIAQFPVTNKARSKYLFTDAVYLDRQALVQRTDSAGNISIKSQLDLAHDTIYVVANSPMRDRIEALSHEIGDTIFIKEETEYNSEQLLIMVATGIIDYAVINAKAAASIADDYPNINIGTKISFTQLQSWALPLSQTNLRDSLNVWIQEIKSSEEYTNLYNRYF